MRLEQAAGFQQKKLLKAINDQEQTQEYRDMARELVEHRATLKQLAKLHKKWRDDMNPITVRVAMIDGCADDVARILAGTKLV